MVVLSVDPRLVEAEAVVLPCTSCGICSSCRNGKVSECCYTKTLGVQQEGCLAEDFVLATEKLTVNVSLQLRLLGLV